MGFDAIDACAEGSPAVADAAAGGRLCGAGPLAASGTEPAFALPSTRRQPVGPL